MQISGAKAQGHNAAFSGLTPIRSYVFEDFKLQSETHNDWGFEVLRVLKVALSKRTKE